MGHEVGDSVIFGLVALHLLFVGQNLCCNRWAETFLHFPKGKHDMPSFFFWEEDFCNDMNKELFNQFSPDCKKSSNSVGIMFLSQLWLGLRETSSINKLIMGSFPNTKDKM